MLFDACLRPAYSRARVNRALVTNGRIFTCQGCMGLSHIHNEYPYRRYEQQNQGFMTGLESYSVQTIYVTEVNVLIALFSLFVCSFSLSLPCAVWCVLLVLRNKECTYIHAYLINCISVIHFLEIC